MNRRDLIKNSGFVLGSAVLSRPRALASVNDTRMILLEPGRSALVMAREQDLGSAEYFVAIFQELTGQKLKIVTTDLPENNQPLILIGDVLTNPKIRELAGEQRCRKVTSQGILLATVSDGRRSVLLVAGGSRAATPGAVGELLNFHLNAAAGQASAPALDWVDNPALPYRIFWNWDHSTNWERGVRGEQEDGCVNPYLKTADDYSNDFRKLLDYMGEHKLNGLILWGFLRDRHGGVDANRRLVEHAFERGVHVLPGIGTSFYGGIYYEGNNRFNVDTWLADNPPELRFLDDQGQRLHNAICPSKAENIRWLREGGEWLFSQFPKLGGANLENGDFFTCQSEDCRRARQKPENDPNFYWDMTVTQLPIIEAARKLNAAAWMVYATYTGFNPDELWKHTDKSLVRSAAPQFISQYPEDAICQWTYTSMVQGWGQEPEAVVRNRWPKGLRPPTKHSVGLLHQGSQWMAADSRRPHGSDVWWTKSPRGNNTGERYVEISELIRYTCQRCAEEGLEGLEILGEVSDASPANEVNYLAFEEFTWHPRKTMDEFVRDRLSHVYGSLEDARRFLAIVRSSERNLSTLTKDLHLADETSNNRQFNARQRRRWTNLRAELARRISLLT
jgi:hypothetical protein